VVTRLERERLRIAAVPAGWLCRGHIGRSVECGCAYRAEAGDQDGCDWVPVASMSDRTVVRPATLDSMIVS
jgi:hypothetical protein